MPPPAVHFLKPADGAVKQNLWNKGSREMAVFKRGTGILPVKTVRFPIK
jgi:hypothetical protein